jgi:hypothetical protein
MVKTAAHCVCDASVVVREWWRARDPRTSSPAPKSAPQPTVTARTCYPVVSSSWGRLALCPKHGSTTPAPAGSNRHGESDPRTGTAELGSSSACRRRARVRVARGGVSGCLEPRLGVSRDVRQAASGDCSRTGSTHVRRAHKGSTPCPHPELIPTRRDPPRPTNGPGALPTDVIVARGGSPLRW